MFLQEAILNPQSGTVIRLDGSAVWLAMPAVASADLYVRPCYLDLIEARTEYIKEHKWGKGCMTIFTGTPGVLQGARKCTFCFGTPAYALHTA